MSEQRVRQSICPVCGQTARPGKGTVLAFGAGGRVHTKKCLALAQKVTPAGVSLPDSPHPREASV
jgi:hypothetical protein